MLSEHALYTTEAWKLFLERLTPGGLLSVSRYYFDPRPDETYRVVSLAVSAWGIAASFWTGVACYAVATVALAAVSRAPRAARVPIGLAPVVPEVD